MEIREDLGRINVIYVFFSFPLRGGIKKVVLLGGAHHKVA